MQRLFWKIFGWFWGAMVLIGLTLFFVVTTAQPDPLPLEWRDATSATMNAYSVAAANAWESGGEKKLANYLDQQSVEIGGRFWLFAGERELTGRPPGRLRRQRFAPQFQPSQPFQPRLQQQFTPPFPPHGGPPADGRPGPPGPPPNAPADFPSQATLDEPPPGMGPRGGGPPPPHVEAFNRLRESAQQTGETQFVRIDRRVLAAHRVRSVSGKTYLLQADIPAPRLGRPAAGPVRQAIGVIAMLLISGVVCYGLVHYITAPLEHLRAATENFARGDLSARTGADQTNRRDEVADLGRDFDVMAERIEALVNSQRRLLGDISHELRSPLARLGMALALARRSVAAGAPAEEIDGSLERIKREAVRLNSLIEQLLEWTRLEGGSSALPTERFTLDDLLQDVVSDTDFEGKSTQRGAVLLRSSPCNIEGSPDLLRSALENVMRNALRYTPPETRVEATLDCVSPEQFWPEGASQKNSTMALITIRDYGVGVPEAALAEIFKPFYRVAESRDRQSGGVGLGLAITERAVRSHKGIIRARNASGGGLQVEIRLPVEKSTQ